MSTAASAREPLPLAPLGRFLAARGLVGTAPLTADRIGDGHSNLTYLVTDGGSRLVVRRPPPPPLPPSAHDVLREARVLAALAGRLPVPRVLATCADEAVIGAPFFVMEHVDGEVITEAVPAALAAPAARAGIADELTDALARLHAVDWQACGLAGFGRPTGYLGRQLRRFGDLWRLNRTRELPLVEAVGGWLAAGLPDSGAATIVHGDYRLGNAMFASGPPARLVALLDWEMATIGDPLADVGYLAALWVQPEDPPLRLFELSEATRAGGFRSREELVGRYAERSGRSVATVRWYEVLALWKLAVAMEGNYRRARAGHVENAYLAGFGQGVVELAERAAELAGISAKSG